MKLSKYNLIIPSANKNQYYLFNTFTGGCFEVDSSIADIIKKTAIDSLQEETKELFALAGILIPNEKNEDHILAYEQGFHKYRNPNYTSTAFLTWDCNLKCSYCFQGLEKNTEHMSMEQADRYINFTLSSAKLIGAKNIAIILFGGEPLMNMEVGLYVLQKVKDYCDENKIGFASTIITNGTLLTSEIIERLYNLNCRTMQVTLDGIKNVHDQRRMYANGKGSFEEIINALRLLNERADIQTVIRINIDRTNLEDTNKLLEYIGKDGEGLTNCVVSFGIVRTHGTGCSGYSSNCLLQAEIGDVLYDPWNHAENQGFKQSIKPKRKYYYCGMYYDNAYSVTPNLEVYKCWEHAGVKEHLMGRIDDHGRLVGQTPAFYEWMSVDPLKNDTGKNCVYLPTCGGGCGVEAYSRTGTYHANSCFTVKGTVEKEVIKFVESIMNPRE